MKPENVTKIMLSIHKDLEEVVQIIEEDYYKKHPEEKKIRTIHPKIEIRMFEGRWMGEYSPSLLNFPFGTMIMRKGVSGKTLYSLLNQMKRETEKQLKNLKKGLVDSVPV